MKTYEKLVRFIKLNDDGPQSCLNTTFTQDHKRKMPNWSINMDIVNTKKWYRKEADLWAELGDEIPFG
jgi:hypothetical protein